MYVFQVSRRIQRATLREQGRVEQEQYVSFLHMQTGPFHVLLLLAHAAPRRAAPATLSPPRSNFIFKNLDRNISHQTHQMSAR